MKRRPVLAALEPGEGCAGRNELGTMIWREGLLGSANTDWPIALLEGW